MTPTPTVNNEPNTLGAVKVPLQVPQFRRDMFAAAALEGLLSNPNYQPNGTNTALLIEDSIHYADAMIADMAWLDLSVHGKN